MVAADFALFDDCLAAADEPASYVLEQPLRALTIRDADGFGAAMAEAEAETRKGNWVALALTYELGHVLEPRAGNSTHVDGLATLVVYARGRPLMRSEVDAFIAGRLAMLPEDARAAGVAAVKADDKAFRSGVRRILRYIEAGDCYQVNFTYPLHFRHFGAPLALFAGLRARQPVRYAAYLETPAGAIVSLSPELFVERHGTRLLTRPMKGTAPRSPVAAEDQHLREALAASEKDRAENLMIVDLLRNDLGRVAVPGSVRVDSLFDVETYPTVFQMTSVISAEAPEKSLGQVLAALFPCGSVTGAPKIRAMQIIEELEAGPRGIYTGAVGFLAPGGDFRLNVAIRTLELGRDGFGRMGVGSGIVADSDPELELRECRLKAAFLGGFDPGFELIETLRLEGGGGRWRYPHIDLHLSRLAASAATLGFACDAVEVRRCLTAEAVVCAARAAGGTYRVRLSLGKDGGCRLASARLDAPASWRVAVSPQRIDSADLLRRHKTTVRHLYEAELARVAGTDCFDVLFCNERGELCEGARSNVFLRLGGRLFTPPVASGLLPGVMRGQLLRRPLLGVVERRLAVDDLRRAEAVYVSNALRGLRRVEVDWEA